MVQCQFLILFTSNKMTFFMNFIAINLVGILKRKFGFILQKSIMNRRESQSKRTLHTLLSSQRGC